MSESHKIVIPEGAIMLSEVHVARYIDTDGVEGVSIGFDSYTGQAVGPIEVLGMLQLAQYYAVTSGVGDDDEDND